MEDGQGVAGRGGQAVEPVTVEEELAIAREANRNMRDRTVVLENQVKYWKQRYDRCEARRKADR